MITVESATRGSDDGSEPRFDFGASAVRSTSPARIRHAEAELRKAVAEGKISGEDARARLEGMRKMMAEQGDIDVVALHKRLGAAIDAGRMTKEEARAKFAEIMKQADAKDKDDD